MSSTSQVRTGHLIAAVISGGVAGGSAGAATSLSDNLELWIRLVGLCIVTHSELCETQWGPPHTHRHTHTHINIPGDINLKGKYLRSSVVLK